MGEANFSQEDIISMSKDFEENEKALELLQLKKKENRLFRKRNMLKDVNIFKEFDPSVYRTKPIKNLVDKNKPGEKQSMPKSTPHLQDNP